MALCIRRICVALLHECAHQEDECDSESNGNRVTAKLEKDCIDILVLGPVVERNSCHPTVQLLLVVTDRTSFFHHVKCNLMRIEIEREHGWSCGVRNGPLEFFIFVHHRRTILFPGSCPFLKEETPSTKSSDIAPFAETILPLGIRPCVDDGTPTSAISWLNSCFCHVQRVHLFRRTTNSLLVRNTSLGSVEEISETLLAQVENVLRPDTRAGRVRLCVEDITATFHRIKVLSVEIIRAHASRPQQKVGHPQSFRVDFRHVRCGNDIFKLLNHLHLCIRMLVVQSSPIHSHTPRSHFLRTEGSPSTGLIVRGKEVFKSETYFTFRDTICSNGNKCNGTSPYKDMRDYTSVSCSQHERSVDLVVKNHRTEIVFWTWAASILRLETKENVQPSRLLTSKVQ
mmetsp:Transcript_32326/g.48003  ORF Transcript_32326/g.48003 Transcript_32326/m.48003 type:complete len:399 (-) Transcript_32326:567-1763(-)